MKLSVAPLVLSFRVQPVVGAAVLTTLLAACGGDEGDRELTQAPTAPVAEAPAPAPAPAPTGLTGSVAVGAPMTGAKVRVLDASGSVAAENIDVAADGTYTIPSLSGTGPFRIEACGYAGANYQCLYTVVQSAGTANVTPLTTATALLASGRSPGEMMDGAASGLGADAVSAAQAQLRTALAPVLEGNVPAGFDFATGSLQAGSRSGYDKVLDAIGVATGIDTKPFVQITPRMGSGNLYMESGSPTTGQVTAATGAASLDLSGVNTLFERINTAIATAETCGHASNGLVKVLASDARFTMGSMVLEGREQFAQGFCQILAEENIIGARFLSPVLGRCDLSRANPVCRVGFGLQRSGSTEVQSLGVMLGIAFENGAWALRGDADDVPIFVSARAQRSQRVDGETVLNRYDRALSIEVPAIDGLQCAHATQRNAAGEAVSIAYLKPMTGANELERLSIWRPTSMAGADSVSQNPAAGSLRNQDDTWLMLPEGDAGDAVARNFFRGGRTVQVALYADASCSVPFNVGGRSRFEVEIDGAPPVWSAMPSLPWPELTAASRSALSSLALAGGGVTTPVNLSWTYPRGNFGAGEAQLCVRDASQCGQGGDGRVADTRPAGGARSITLEARNTGSAVAANGYKSFALNGRASDGISLQANFQSCAQRPAGESCH